MFYATTSDKTQTKWNTKFVDEKQQDKKQTAGVKLGISLTFTKTKTCFTTKFKTFLVSIHEVYVPNHCHGIYSSVFISFPIELKIYVGHTSLKQERCLKNQFIGKKLSYNVLHYHVLQQDVVKNNMCPKYVS